MAGTEHPIVYEDSGTIYYRASALGSCDRALVAARQGYEPSPPPAKLQEVFNAGHAAEEWFVNKYPVTRAQEEVKLEIPGTNCVVVGHIDGVIDDHILEVKSQSPDQFDTFEDSWKSGLWIKYAWQVSVYMHALDLPLVLIRVRRNPDGTFTQAPHQLAEPPVSLTAIRARVNSIETRAREDSLPDCELQTWGCPYWTLHDTRPLETDDDLDIACAVYKDAQADTRAAKAVEDNARERLLKLLGERTSVATTGGWSVKHTSYEVREHVVKAGTRTKLTVSELEL